MAEARFPIERARERLGVVPTTAIRADIDVRTGQEAIWAAVSAFGGAMADVGRRYDLKEANTQLSEYQRNVKNDNILRAQELKYEVDPAKYEAIFKAHAETQAGFMPTNKRALSAAIIWNNLQIPIQRQALIDAIEARGDDNWWADLFKQQQEVALGTRSMTDFQKFLARGIVIDRNNPSEIGRPLDKLQAVKILADTRKLIEATIVRNQREQVAALQVMREQTMAKMLADIWDNTLTDPQVITAALRAGHLDDTDAKYLRNAVMNPKPPETTSKALIAIRYAINGMTEGTETRESALKKVIQYSSQLSPVDGKAFVKEIFAELDTQNAFWNRQAHEYMERQIMEVATSTGILWGSGEQLALSANALLAYDLAKKEAAITKKPLKGRELLELAHEVMLPFRQEIKPLVPGEEIPSKLTGIAPKRTISAVQRSRIAIMLTSRTVDSPPKALTNEELEVLMDFLKNDEKDIRAFLKKFNLILPE